LTNPLENSPERERERERGREYKNMRCRKIEKKVIDFYYQAKSQLLTNPVKKSSD